MTKFNGGTKKDHGSVVIDEANKTVTVLPDEGYAVNTVGIKVSDMHECYDLATLGEVTIDDTTYTNADQQAAITAAKDNSGYAGITAGRIDQGYVFTYDKNISIEDILVEVNIYEDDSKVSIRKEDKTTDSYQSAGIRFRGSLTKTQRGAASEIGFVVAPKKLADNCANGIWYEFDSTGTPNLGDKAKIAKVYVYNGDPNKWDGKNFTTSVVYKDYYGTDSSRDY